MTETNRPVDTTAARFAVILFAAVAPMILLVAPVVVGGLVARAGFTPRQAGYVIAAELAGMALATFPALVWIPRVGWNRAMALCVGLMVAGNLLSLLATDFPLLAVIRFLTALGSGSIMIICIVVMSGFKEPERLYGLWLVAQIAVGSIALWLLPGLLSLVGINGFFLGLALLYSLLLPVARMVPTLQLGVTAAHSDPGTTSLTSGLLGLAAIFCFEAAVSGVWTYVERVGDGAGMGATQIGRILALTSLFGIVGSGCAAWLGSRHGRLPPVLVGFGIMLCALAILTMPVNPVSFLVATGAFKYSWTFIFPYLLGLVAVSDSSGKLVIGINLVAAGGLAVGPGVSAFTLGIWADYNAVMAVGGATTFISLLLVLFCISRHRLHGAA